MKEGTLKRNRADVTSRIRERVKGSDTQSKSSQW